MRIAWRNNYEKAQPQPQTIQPHVKRTVVETPNPTLDKLERDISLMASVSVAELAMCRLGHSVPENASTFSHFLADSEQFEGTFRSVLLDTSLSRFQTARLNRIFRSYQLLRPIAQLRRHIEFPILSLNEHNDFIRHELTKTVEAVTALGRKAAATMREPGWSAYLEAHATHGAAQQLITESRRRFQAVLTPGAFRTSQAALLALEVASSAYLSLAREHSEALRPEVINKMGAPIPAPLNNELTMTLV